MAKLRPRARIIRTIGDQLISGPEAAIIELVKNAYDADAKSVLIKLSPPSPDTNGGQIAVCDNGHGMSYEDVVGRWFEPATDEKLKRNLSPGGRRMLGAKGIGRFAASRLGRKTVLRTWSSKDQEMEETVVAVDWEDFSADKYLDSIDIPIERSASRNSVSGVEMTISDLRDTWSKSRLERLVRELRRVASPSLTEKSFSIHLDLSDFTTEDAGFDGSEVLRKANFDFGAPTEENGDPTTIIPFRVYEHADYTLEGVLSDDGAFLGTFTNFRGDGAAQELSVPAPASDQDHSPCGSVSLRINIYDRETEAIESLFGRMGLNFSEIGIRAARRILTDNSGIALYREGFRIRPYGEPENDWLELESKRVQNPSKKLGISQVSGRVEVGSEAESDLIERSSREGLEHNGSFSRLKFLIQGVLTHAEERRLDFREKAGLSRKPTGDLNTTKSLATLPEVRKEAAKAPSPFKARLDRAIEKDSAALSASLDELDAYQKLLQSRAALGLVVAQLIHEGRRILNPLSQAARALTEDADHLLSTAPLGEVARRHLPEHLRVISTGTKELSRLIKRLDPLSGRRRGSPRNFDVRELIVRSLELFTDPVKDAGITVDVSNLAPARAYGYPEDVQAAAMNIIENGIFWLNSLDSSSERDLMISTDSSKDSIHVLVSNNGPQIDPTYIPRLFQAGFSLRSEGTGLGLAIAREACRASKGDLIYDETKEDTTFIISIPAAKDL